MKSYSSNVMINVKSILRIGFLLCSIFLLSHPELKATHIVGGDMTYRCLGNNVYEIKLIMRRDCFQGASNAQFDDPASIGLFDGTTHNLITDIIGYPDGQLLIPFNSSDTLNEFVHSDCGVITGDVCVHTTMYIKTIFLPYRVTGYTFAYQRCCRNVTLDNIVSPLNTGMTIVAELSGIAQLAANSSPQFGDYPPVYECVNKEIFFDHHATDEENDSLVYSLCTPYAGGTILHPKPQPPPEPPYDLVVWKPPYNLGNLLGGDPLTIDPKTGIITGKPNSVGQFVVGICVTAYKRGTNFITGVTRRDFQFNIRLCRDVPVANFSAPSLECNTQTISFVNNSIRADKYEWIFDFGDTLSGTSHDTNPVFSFLQPGCHQVALVASDNFGFCHDTVIHEVCAYPSPPSADFDFAVTGCIDSIQVEFNDLSFDPGNYPIVTWNWLLTYPGGVLISTEQNPHFSFQVEDEATIFILLRITSANGCTASITKSFPVRVIEPPILFGDTTGMGSEYICFGDSVHLLENGDSTLTYTWDPHLGLNLEQPWDPIAYPGVTTEYFVTVTDGLCDVTAHTIVIVRQLPTIDFTSETNCLDLKAEFTNSSNGEKYLWDFGVPNTTADTTSVINPVFTFPDSGLYTVTLYSKDGCNVFTSHEVTVNNITETLDLDHKVQCFGESVELNPIHNSGYLYTWSNGSHDPNPVVTVTNDETFYVTVSSPGLPDCEITDSIRILVPDDFTVHAPGDFTNCYVRKDTLTATVDGNQNVHLVWTSTEGDSLGEGASLIVNPDTTTSYIVTATDTLGCSKSDMVTISKSNPGFTVNIVQNNMAYCDIQIITLNAESVNGVTFDWFNADIQHIGSGPSVEVTPGTPSCFYVVGTNELQCQNKDSVCLTPTFFDLSISGDQSICLDDQVEICITNNASGQDLSYLWFPADSIDFGGTTDCASVSPTQTTTYCGEVTNVQLGCKDTLCSQIVVNLLDPLLVSISSDAPNDSIIQGDDIQLFVNQLDHTYKYTWTSSNGDIVPGVWNPVFVPSGPGTYTVTVENAQGCTGTASITIRVFNPPCNDDDIFLPTAFSPNNDGVNDVLLVRSNFITTFELHIFNRWGEQVFKTNDPTIGWNGQYKGARLPPDVFGYFMKVGCPNGRSFFKKGNITLLE